MRVQPFLGALARAVTRRGLSVGDFGPLGAEGSLL